MGAVDFRRLGWPVVLSLVAFAVASAGVRSPAPRVEAAPMLQEGKALGIDHAYVLGWSMGSHVGQELVLKYPQRVDRLILYASLCGGPEAIRAPETMKQFTDSSGGPLQRGQRLLNLILPPAWVRDHL